MSSSIHKKVFAQNIGIIIYYTLATQKVDATLKCLQIGASSQTICSQTTEIVTQIEIGIKN